MKEFDWTMGSQNAQTSDQNQNAFEKIDVGQCASKALGLFIVIGAVILITITNLLINYQFF